MIENGTDRGNSCHRLVTRCSSVDSGVDSGVDNSAQVILQRVRWGEPAYLNSSWEFQLGLLMQEMTVGL